MLRREDGAITVFFSITIMVFIIFAAVIVEGSRIAIAELQGHRALEVSGEALLAGYNSILKKDYGLYALANPNQDSMRSKLQDYFYNNIVEGQEEFWSLYDYSLGDIELLLRDSLNEAPIVKEQILHLMKYKGIQAIGETFLEKLQVLSSSRETLEAFDKKLKLEREMQQLSQLQQELRQAVELVKGFDKVLLDINIKRIPAATAEILTIRSEIKQVEQEMQGIRVALGNTPGLGAEELNNTLYNCSLKLQQLNYSLVAAKEDLRKTIEDVDITIKGQQEINLSIRDVIERIKLQSSIVNYSLEEYKREYQINRAKLQQELQEGFDKELDYYQRLIEPEELRQLQELARENADLVGEAIIQLEGLKGKAMACIDSLSFDLLNEVTALANSCSFIIRGYNTALTYEIPKVPPVEGDSEKELRDNRSSNSKEAKSKLQEAVEGKDVIITADILNLLPSRGVELVNSNKEEVEFDESKAHEGYTEKGLGELGNVLSNLKNVGLDLRDRLFINEYIVGYFKHYTTQHSTEKGPQYTNSRRSYFDYEVEYVLYGNPSQLKNISEAKRDILLTRFVLNLIYIYTQPQMLNRATVIASALAAPLSAAAMPIIKTMIIAGWSMGYSLEELDKLLKGEEIPLMRNNESIKTEYKDYLRLFLLGNGTSLDKRLNRIMDLIQLNFYKLMPADTEFVQWDFYTGFELRTEYSIKYLFMQLPFMQRELGVSGGRYSFKKTIWNGY